MSVRLTSKKKKVSWSINKWKQQEKSNLLLDFGKYAEKIYVLNEDEYNRKLLKSHRMNGRGLPFDSEEHYHYLKIGNLFVRSQIDCCDPTLPSDNNTFDIKTRATFGIRTRINEWKEHTSYTINTLLGKENSYEREIYDLVRSTLIKYIYQVRLGKMAGIFMVFHNTIVPYGFKYFSLETMDKLAYGSSYHAEIDFKITTQSLDKILTTITEDFKDQNIKSLKLLMTNYRGFDRTLRILVRPSGYSEDEMDEIIGKNGYLFEENRFPISVYHFKYHIQVKNTEQPKVLLFNPGDPIRVGFQIERESSPESQESLEIEWNNNQNNVV